MLVLHKTSVPPTLLAHADEVIEYGAMSAIGPWRTFQFCGLISTFGVNL